MNNELNKFPTPQFIEQELRRVGLDMRKSSTGYMMVCPFHRDTDPSLGVNITGTAVPPGVFHCFSCHEKGTWNKLATRLGLRLWNSDDEDAGLYIIRNKRDIQSEITSDGLVLRSWTDDYSWKTYKSDFLSKFGAKLLYDKRFKRNYLYLPFTYLTDLYGYVKVRLNKTDPGPKYWFSSGLKKIIYPIDYVSKQPTDCVVLVEGIADAFRCIQNGIPALALLGLELTPFMLEQLESLAIKTIILCMDGDNAGQNAILGSDDKEGLAKKLEDEGYDVRVVVPPDGSDPDDMPIKYVKALKRMHTRLNTVGKKRII